MKKLVLTVTASLACLAAFAQGRLSFQNDSLHLVYFDQTVGGSLGGAAVLSGAAGQPSLLADLYVGTSSSSLSLITSTTFSSLSQGKWNSLTVVLPAGYPGGSQVFVVAQIHDAGTSKATLTPADLQNARGLGGSEGFSFIGLTPEFTFIPGTSQFTPPPLWNTGSLGGGGSSTWPAGSYPMDFVGVPGSMGSIGVVAVPEPASFALAGLGAAAMLIFRRRK